MFLRGGSDVLSAKFGWYKWCSEIRVLVVNEVWDIIIAVLWLSIYLSTRLLPEIRLILIDSYIRWLCCFWLHQYLFVFKSLRDTKAQVCICNRRLFLSSLLMCKVGLLLRFCAYLWLRCRSTVWKLYKISLILINSLRESSLLDFINLVTVFRFVFTNSLCYIVTWWILITLYMVLSILLCVSWSHPDKRRLSSV